MRLVLRATHQATATNYGHEGHWGSLYNVPALSTNNEKEKEKDHSNQNRPDSQTDKFNPGPFWTEASLRQGLERPNKWILTKTHCTSHEPGARDPFVCLRPTKKRNNHHNNDQNTTTTSTTTTTTLPQVNFRETCSSGYRLVPEPELNNNNNNSNNNIITTEPPSSLSFRQEAMRYDPEYTVGKVIHLMRHPLENLVSRFHLQAQNQYQKWNRQTQQEQQQQYANHPKVSSPFSHPTTNATTITTTTIPPPFPWLLDDHDNSMDNKNHSNHPEDEDYDEKTKDPEQFQRYCAWLNAHPKYACWRRFLPTTGRTNGTKNTTTATTTDVVLEPPCWPDLLKYVWWHNQAFAMTRTTRTTSSSVDSSSSSPSNTNNENNCNNNIYHTSSPRFPSMVLYYEDYATDFVTTRRHILHWLEQQPPVPKDTANTPLPPDPEFQWRDYQSSHYPDFQPRASSWRAIHKWASPTTWFYLQQRYTVEGILE